ncbi:MAG: Na+/H+ antiporter NhaC family protein [Clostridia bacterium]|nr:Na+/H+ antiporter NhaC family protein [Clostridia bacterium]
MIATAIVCAVFIGLFVIAALTTGAPAEEGTSRFFKSYWSLLPPVIAIVLALLTKEVYSSLFVGIVSGALLFSDFNLEGTLTHAFEDGIVASVADASNVGIIVFLVVLGILVVLMNKAGGSAAFGRWASAHIKSRIGAQIATIVLGILIFIDDYFNCLTVGSVMRPVTDKSGISRAKLAYLIDATAAPVCIIAPVSSWAAAVSSYVRDGNGLQLFIQAIPFNFYALLTIVMMVFISLTGFDFGPMAKHEKNAKENGDIFSGMKQLAETAEEKANEKGRVVDLVIPVVILIVCCIIGMIYSGGFFDGSSFIDAFSNSDASVGLMLGSGVSLIITFLYYLARRVLSFKEMAACVPEGFKSMVPAILILTFAWSLKAMTDSLGAKEFVESVVKGSASGLQYFLPVIVFLIACFLSFATGTSWGTFGILIPITLSVFPLTNPLGIVCMSACMAGAVCGDHCSPISDTTIMASAGAQCDHVTHVSTQLPYAVTAAAVSALTYLIAGFLPNVWIVLPVGIALMIGAVILLHCIHARREQ